MLCVTRRDAAKLASRSAVSDAPAASIPTRCRGLSAASDDAESFPPRGAHALTRGAHTDGCGLAITTTRCPAPALRLRQRRVDLPHSRYHICACGRLFLPAHRGGRNGSCQPPAGGQCRALRDLSRSGALVGGFKASPLAPDEIVTMLAAASLVRRRECSSNAAANHGARSAAGGESVVVLWVGECRLDGWGRGCRLDVGGRGDARGDVMTSAILARNVRCVWCVWCVWCV